MEQIGNLVGFEIHTSWRQVGAVRSATFSIPWGGVILRSGKQRRYGPCSLSTGPLSTPGVRLFMLDPALTVGTFDEGDRVSFMLNCDADTSLPRGVYPGGLIVIGIVDIPLGRDDQPAEKPIDTRERISLLRVIRALDAMARLPGRGAAGSVEKQLEMLGFTGPKDATIRRILDDARALEPDTKSQ